MSIQRFILYRAVNRGAKASSCYFDGSSQAPCQLRGTFSTKLLTEVFAVFPSTSAFRGNMRMRSFFNKQQTTPHYLREGPHNSAKVTEIIDTSANKGEDGLKMMAELASQRVVLPGPKHNQWVSGASDL